MLSVIELQLLYSEEQLHHLKVGDRSRLTTLALYKRNPWTNPQQPAHISTSLNPPSPPSPNQQTLQPRPLPPLQNSNQHPLPHLLPLLRLRHKPHDPSPPRPNLNLHLHLPHHANRLALSHLITHVNQNFNQRARERNEHVPRIVARAEAVAARVRAGGRGLQVQGVGLRLGGGGGGGRRVG